MRGQAALEYLVMMGLALAMLIPIWFYVNSTLASTRAEVQSTYAKAAVAKLRDAADAAYIQGPPARMYLELMFPDNIASATVGPHEIIMRLQTQGGLSDVYSVTIGEVQGSLPTRGGLVRVLVKAEGTGPGPYYVNVTDNE